MLSVVLLTEVADDNSFTGSGVDEFIVLQVDTFFGEAGLEKNSKSPSAKSFR